MKLYNHVVFKMGKHEAEIAPHIPEAWKLAGYSSEHIGYSSG